jgi:hypothetical protein
VNSEHGIALTQITSFLSRLIFRWAGDRGDDWRMRPARHGKEKYDYGYAHGQIAAKFELMEQVRKRLGSDYKNDDGYEPFLEVKADAIVVVERNGVKTLRVYELKGAPTSLQP